MSFDDFQALFEVERESAMTKRLKTTASDVSMLNDNTEGPGSPPSKVKRRLPEVPDTSGVVMRHRPGRSLHRNSDFGLLSPIKPGTGQSSRPRSNEYQGIYILWFYNAAYGTCTILCTINFLL